MRTFNRRAARYSPGFRLVGRYQTGGTSLSTAGATVPLSTLIDGLDSQPSEGDIIVIALAPVGLSDYDLSIKDSSGGADYQIIGPELYIDGSRDSNLRVAYKIAGAIPDTSAFIDTGNATSAYNVAVEVWRGVDAASPLDVTPQYATNGSDGQPIPPAITPITGGALILSFSNASAYYNTGDIFTSSDFDEFISRVQVGSFSSHDATIGVGSLIWMGGTLTPAQLGGGNDSTSNTWASITAVLRPE